MLLQAERKTERGLVALAADQQQHTQLAPPVEGEADAESAEDELQNNKEEVSDRTMEAATALSSSAFVSPPSAGPPSAAESASAGSVSVAAVLAGLLLVGASAYGSWVWYQRQKRRLGVRR